MRVFNIFLFAVFFMPVLALAESRTFSHFAAELPEGWDGEEKKGFVGGNPQEYLLALGKLAEDKPGAQINIYMLPNKAGLGAQEAARQLAKMQADSTEPQKTGGLWTFTGEPRTNILKGRATTLVNANPETMLVIIVQDPAQLGAEEVLASLRGISESARALLGR